MITKRIRKPRRAGKPAARRGGRQATGRRQPERHPPPSLATATTAAPPLLLHLLPFSDEPPPKKQPRADPPPLPPGAAGEGSASAPPRLRRFGDSGGREGAVDFSFCELPGEWGCCGSARLFICRIRVCLPGLLLSFWMSRGSAAYVVAFCKFCHCIVWRRGLCWLIIGWTTYRQYSVGHPFFMHGLQVAVTEWLASSRYFLV